MDIFIKNPSTKFTRSESYEISLTPTFGQILSTKFPIQDEENPFADPDLIEGMKKEYGDDWIIVRFQVRFLWEGERMYSHFEINHGIIGITPFQAHDIILKWANGGALFFEYGKGRLMHIDVNLGEKSVAVHSVQPDEKGGKELMFGESSRLILPKTM